MFNLFDYIKLYCQNRNIKNYDVKSRVLTLKDFANTQTFAPGFAFFYKMQVSGEINNIANLQNPFMLIQTPTEIFNFAEIATVKDFGSIQTAESEFVFVADNMLTVDLRTGSNFLFQNICSAQLMYLYATPLPYNSNKDSHNVLQVDINN